MNKLQAYRALCLTLAGHSHRVDWPAFSSADCDRLIATARAEGVAPLLYHALEGREWKGENGRGKREKGKRKREKGKGKGDSILHSPFSTLHSPSSILHELRAAYYATAAHNLLLSHELTRILQAIDN